jgi:hypothetical protein
MALLFVVRADDPTANADPVEEHAEAPADPDEDHRNPENER